jgi:hypothetical protein
MATTCDRYGPKEIVGVFEPLELEHAAGVSLQTESERCEIRLSRDPAAIDFSALAGPARRVELQLSDDFHGGEDQWSPISNLMVADPVGIAYVGGTSDDWAEQVFGRRAVRLGARAAKDREDDWIWSFHTIRFAGDDGSVELLPGEVASVILDGQEFWAIAHTAVVIDARRRSDVGFCIDYGGWTRKLSYELRRADLFGLPAPSTPDHDFAPPSCR